MKKLVYIVIILVLMVTISGCAFIPNANVPNYFKNLGHKHSFSDATCTEPQMCECGEIGKGPLGHDWSDATCTEPQRCFCGATNGEAKGHTWLDATCTTPMICKDCCTTEGYKAMHEFVDGVCKDCYQKSIGLKFDGPYYIVSFDEKCIEAYSFDKHGGFNISSVYTLGEPMYDYEETIIYKGKTYFSGGVGAPGYQYTIIGEEIVVYEFESTTEIQMKMTVDDNGNLVVTYNKYPDSTFGDVGTVWLSSLD